MGNWQQKWESWRDMTAAMQQEIKIEAAEKVTSYIKMTNLKKQLTSSDKPKISKRTGF